MRIRWLGHASFLLESGRNRIITDPFDEACGYLPFTEPVDIATISHDHWDHNAVGHLAGQPKILKDQLEPVQANGISIQGFSSYHDNHQGRDRGSNTLYKFLIEDISVLHSGDQGTLLQADQICQIGPVDILLVPVGGKYTLDASEAVRFTEQIQPRLVIPMHYHTKHVTIDLAPVEDFTSRFDQVVKCPYLKITKEQLPDQLQVMVMDYLSG